MSEDPLHYCGAQLTPEDLAELRRLPWIPIADRKPPRNKPAIYWRVTDSGGYIAIADEWRDEHHLANATHWMPYEAPTNGDSSV